MTLSNCLISQEPPGMKEFLLQARIDGKSWKQIADEFDYKSPAGARSAFKKITGLNDFQIKGKELENLLSYVGTDDLKKVLPKKPPKTKVASEAVEEIDDVATGSAKVTQNYLEPDGVMKEAFPNWPGKTYLDNTGEYQTYMKSYKGAMSDKYDLASISDELSDQFGNEVVLKVFNKLSNGSNYGVLKNEFGLSFEQLDRFNWARLLSDSGGDVWKAYAAKPTSEVGFKAVQDMVWQLKKLGADKYDIYTSTSVPHGVFDLISANTWKLPSPGSTQFVSSIGSSAATPSAATTYNQTAKQLLGEKSKFPAMTEEQADNWAVALGKDLSDRGVKAVKKYTSSGYRIINGHLRGTRGFVDSDIEDTIRALQETMRPLPYDVSVRRGVGADTFPGGVPQVGDVFMDPAFLSTSYGDGAAFGGKYLMVMDLPAGTMARPVHTLSSVGRGEREILVNSAQQYMITGVDESGGRFGTITVYMKARVMP